MKNRKVGVKDVSESQAYETLMKQASKFLGEIEANLRPAVLRSTLWIF